MQVYNSTQFDWDPKGRMFVAEASELNAVNDDSNNSSYDGDSFIMESAKTGTFATFQVVERKKDKENDLLYWILRPTDVTLSRLPNLKGVKVTIFND